MDDQALEVASAEQWHATIARRLEERRGQAQATLGQQRDRIRQLESQLDQSLQQLASDQLELQQQREDLAREREALAELDRQSHKQRRHVAQQLRARKKELTAEVELHRCEALASAQGQELQLQIRLTELQTRCDRLQEELAQRDQQQDDVCGQLAQQQPALEQAQAEVRKLADALRQAEMQQQVAQGESQRYRDMLAQERETADRQRESLRQQATLASDKVRGDLQTELDRLREELTQAQSNASKLQDDLALTQLEGERRLIDLRSELQHAGAGSSETLQRQFKQWEDERSRLQMRLDEQLQERATLEAELHQHREQTDGAQVEHSSAQALWQAERNRLEAQLVEAQLQAEQQALLAAEVDRIRAEKKQLETALANAQRNADAAGSSQETDDLRRRFEMAVQDVRELKTKNADLAEQLAKAKQAASKATGVAAAASGAMDWEQRKQQLLAKLEADSDDEEDEKSQADRLTIEGTIRMTDQIVADKERELIELRKLLEDQSSSIGGLAVGAAAIAGMLDGDELIQQERATLKQMQEQLQEQLKHAEIDISVERARLARERSEMDERIRNFEQERAKFPGLKEPPATDGKKKSSGTGRWLSRLGLRDGDG